MRQSIIVVLIYVVLVQNSLCIYVPGDSNVLQQKPPLSSGIQTTQYKSVQFHHNYSKVASNNNQTVKINHDNYSSPIKVYPIFSNQPPPTRTIKKRPIFKRKIQKPIEVYQKCPPKSTGQYVYEMSCNQFLNCWNGRGQVENCAPGTLFNPKTLSCDFPSKVECITGPRQNSFEINERSLKSVPQAFCPEGFSGLIPNYTDCSKFINCNHGQMHNQDCPPGTHFNAVLNVCDFPQKAFCFNGGTGNYETGTKRHLVNQFHRNDKINECGSKSCQNRKSNYNTIMNVKDVFPNYDITGRATGCNPGSRNCNLGQYSQIPICNPATHNCNQPPSETVYCDPRSQNCNQQVSPTGPLCNPSFGNCNSHQPAHTINYNPKIPNYNQQHQQNSGPRAYCNPHLENCNPPGKSCDPRTQNCNQHPSPTNCNPITQNCSPQPPNYGTSSNCDPRTQNCNSQTSHQTSSTICNPNTQNCAPNNPRTAQRQEHSIAFPNSDPKCPAGFQGITKHPTDCAKFLNCANGMTFVQNCAPGTLFNPNLGNCDFPYNVKCQNGGDGNSFVTTTERYETTEYVFPYARGNVKPHKINSNPQSQYYATTYNHNGRNDLNENAQKIHQNPNNCNNKQNCVNQPNRHPINNKLEIDESHVVGTFKHNVEKTWPPPFPEKSSTDNYADYDVYDYDDEDMGLVAENSIQKTKVKQQQCNHQEHFYCDANNCISKFLVCNGKRDCTNGNDEKDCAQFLEQFEVHKNSRLAIEDKQKWENVTFVTCAMLCIESRKFHCKSFNYRKIDKTCFLTDTNIGQTGALIYYYPCDYYELKSTKIDCTNMYKCANNKCIKHTQICDGQDDCGDRMDEKHCKVEEIGYKIRLAGTDKVHQGRVEIEAFGKMGYVCDDQFGMLDAKVICKELGFPLGAAEVKGNSYFAQDLNQLSTFYMMDDVACTGNESSLKDCDFNGWGVHDCANQEIAGVVCKTSQETCGNHQWKCDTGNECIMISFVCDGLNDCADESDEGSQYCDAPSEFRLVNGSSAKQGRLEVKHHGVWGTVCDDDFNDDAAKVICRYLGYSGKAKVRKESYFGSGNGPIWLDQVSCYGNESNLEECAHWNWGEHNCDHSEDVGVICDNHGDVEETQRNFKAIESSLPVYPTTCGFQKNNIFLQNDDVHFRVVKGSVAKPGDYPWQASIRIRGNGKPAHWCGAVLISHYWLLTAAHCLEGYSKGAYLLVVGDYNVDEDEGTEQQAYIEEFFIHENFREGQKMNNDIALIKVKKPGFKLNQDVQPICLSDLETDYESMLNCTISGFGSVQSGKSAFSHNLRAGWVPIQRTDVCKMPHIYGSKFTEGMICAGFLEDSVDACDGDSGGPLACLNNGLFTLYGLTSWGQHCGYANKPGVYVKVGHYRKWIDNKIQTHS